LLAQLGRLLIDKEKQYNTSIYLISDEAYRKIVFDGLTYPWVLHHYPNSITLTSHSKDLSLPGERIGYMAVHPECADHKDLVNGSIFCNRILGFVNAPALMQHLVKNLQRINIPIEEYQKKRDTLYLHLTDMGYSVNKPEGAFYMFPKSPIKDDIAFVNKLQQLKVLTVPGAGFGTPGYFRIAYCVSNKTINGALIGLQEAIKTIN
jgi:aspartate aminotransferase